MRIRPHGITYFSHFFFTPAGLSPANFSYFFKEYFTNVFNQEITPNKLNSFEYLLAPHFLML